MFPHLHVTELGMQLCPEEASAVCWVESNYFSTKLSFSDRPPPKLLKHRSEGGNSGRDKAVVMWRNQLFWCKFFEVKQRP